MAIPTAFANPCPNGPVEQSTPGVIPFSGCPGVLEERRLNDFKSSIVKAYPTINKVAYNKAEP